ncbi:heme lyase CcmF/NrfE family subunit [Sedimenticola selenatireducens]|uniref:Heme lyase CcmF/NrfE family subunit n=1 Tax=Sedimenticola selenatireducens TaxID=191960 RepID=A0A558DYW7_9GAMM|nr:heme lyase CcmF/NrfE family subunit [Sedimenticola selenatireducens]TVO71911.1 heme lyase CcmF/NrfE family subunit [Sedimenticola selenatireducens]TVT66291.1 MAG: heme lyase CcmF/NrfE family subunit [Sedimenticola selenatireducens]
MIPELGHVALILALSLALIQATLPIIGAHKGIASWVAVARPAAMGQLFFMLVSYGCLTYAFLVHDFSVSYVAQNSNTQLPTLYLISGVWGAHEGSLLLWALMLSLWTGAVVLFSRSMPETMIARVVGVMGFISVGFLLFMLFTSNPFDRLINAPIEGRDLNPLLQDPGLAIHPPMLYMGYVGFSVAFAFAIAAMLGGRLDAAWARWSRPWTNVAWSFLTLGIVLGSWWAYYELGWGGWWFWDPVENASFMPWLVGTALIHSLAVTEKRGAFKAWTVLLAIFAFSLSLLGTFLVRSGVLTSVHAFASDPSRGIFILIFLIVVIGGSLLLYSWRASQIRSSVSFNLVSRETGLLLNNVILVVAASSVLLGTLYPLAIDALGLGKISVGPPYFNSVFIPLTAPLAALVGVGALTRWRQDSGKRLFARLQLSLLVSVVAGFALMLFAPFFAWGAVIALILAIWVLMSTLQWLLDRKTAGRSLLQAMENTPRSGWGMVCGHLGIAVFVVGVTLTSIYSEEKDVRLEPGQSYSLGGYDFIFHGAKRSQGPNYQAFRAEVDIEFQGKHIAHLNPEKRNYKTGMPMTEAGIDDGLFRDLFVALGEPLGTDGAWSVRLYHKPFVRWVWLGGLFMALGGLLAASDRRYYRLKKKASETVGEAGVSAA